MHTLGRMFCCGSLLALVACQPTPPDMSPPQSNEAVPVEPLHAEPIQAEPIQAEPTQAEPTQTESTRTSPMPDLPVAQHSAEAFFDNESVYGSAISSDGKAILVTSDKTGVYNLYRYPVNGEAPQQLTFSKTDAYSGIGWFPSDDRFLYQADKGGNELTHIYAQHPNGQITDLTPGAQVKAQFLGWDRDDLYFYLATNERDPRSFDVYRYRTDNYQRSEIFRNQQSLALGSISPNGRYLAMLETHSNTDNDVIVMDLTYPGGRAILVTDSNVEANHAVFSFTPDSQSLIYGSNAKGEFTAAYQYDLEQGGTQQIYADSWDVSAYFYSRQGRYRVSAINADAQTQIAIWDTQAGTELSLPPLPEGNLSGVSFSRDESTLVFYLESDVSPANLYSYVIGGKLRQLTDTLNPDIRASDLVHSSVEQFKSYDGEPIPGLLYRPHGANVQQTVPAVIWVHGGPGGQSRKGYNPVIQHLVNHGYAVFAVNNRGSAGYGKTFYHLDDQRHGEDDLEDIVFGKRYLAGLPWINPNQIGVMGGSYGGYLTMAAMTFTKEFDAGINIFGVTNWVRTLESIPPWWASFRAYLFDELGDPDTDKDRLYRISPLFHAEQISSPVLVVQGANDPRVLKQESDDIVAAIQSNGVPVEYILFADEGHGFRKKANRIIAQESYLKFLDKYLRSAPDGNSAVR